jgi:hypothetical protein
MHNTSLLGLGVVLAFLGPFFFVAGLQNSSAFSCTTVGVRNCFFTGYDTSLALSMKIMGLLMTGIRVVLVAVVVLAGPEKKKRPSLP